jgi:hypothetical protein
LQRENSFTIHATSTLKETKNDAPKLPAGSMLNQKTNEDFNKKSPTLQTRTNKKGKENHNFRILKRMNPNLQCQVIQSKEAGNKNHQIKVREANRL